jgi:phosphonate degradation associated HDIG domain protein
MSAAHAELSGLFGRWGVDHYDERVSQVEHAVQCARLAQESGADDELVVAALLHDVGHLLELERRVGAVDLASNDAHESTGAAHLARFFGPGVTAPIALHVEAKRYLCTVEPDYHATLSAGSVRSLELQGGRMDADEAARFAAHPAAQRAVALRRWDEAGKDLNPSGLSFDDFADAIRRASRTS